MKRVLMVSMAVLLAGATVMPVAAQDVRARVVAGAAAQDNKGPMRVDRREDRREDRRGNRHDRRDDRRDWRADRRDDRYDRRDDRRDWRHDRREDRRDWRDDRRDNYRYVRHDDRRWRGYQWRPEHRYRAPARYVDYHAYRLPPPPYGYRWVRSDRDVVLVALATGLVLDVLYDLYY